MEKSTLRLIVALVLTFAILMAGVYGSEIIELSGFFGKASFLTGTVAAILAWGYCIFGEE